MVSDRRFVARVLALAIAGLLNMPFADSAFSEDVVVRPFPEPVAPGCIGWAEPEYTVDFATFLTRFDRDPETCPYYGAVTVTVTMTREDVSGITHDPTTTVTSTTKCPEVLDCEIRVSMPHPNIELKALYAMSWIFHGDDGGEGWKEEGRYCESYVTVAKCGWFYYWYLRIPDP